MSAPYGLRRSLTTPTSDSSLGTYFIVRVFSYDYVFDWNTKKNDPTAPNGKDRQEGGQEETGAKDSGGDTKHVDITGHGVETSGILANPTTTAESTAAALTVKLVPVDTPTPVTSPSHIQGVGCISGSQSPPAGPVVTSLTDTNPLQLRPPQIISSPPAFHLDHATSYCNQAGSPDQKHNGDISTETPVIILTGCSPLPSPNPSNTEYLSPTPQLLSAAPYSTTSGQTPASPGPT